RRLTLSGQRDALDMPRLNLDMRIADSDFDHYRRTLSELGRQLLASRTGMIRLNYNHREQWLKAMDWGNHHLGTTRMSDDPKKGVVDAQGRVHGMANLYVAGSSLFPTYGASNPTLNLVALTLRLADHLKKVMALDGGAPWRDWPLFLRWRGVRPGNSGCSPNITHPRLMTICSTRLSIASRPSFSVRPH